MTRMHNLIFCEEQIWVKNEFAHTIVQYVVCLYSCTVILQITSGSSRGLELPLIRTRQEESRPSLAGHTKLFATRKQKHINECSMSLTFFCVKIFAKQRKWYHEKQPEFRRFFEIPCSSLTPKQILENHVLARESSVKHVLDEKQSDIYIQENK